MTVGDGLQEGTHVVDDRPRDVSEEPRTSVSPPAPTSRRRAAGFLLLLGIGLATAPLLDATPAERRFVVVLSRASLERVELVWRDADGEVLRSVVQHFPQRSPSTLERTLRLEAGRCFVDITTVAAGRTRKVTRTVDLRDDTSEVRVNGP